MGALRRDSLVWRLLVVLAGAFAVTAVLVFLIVDTGVRSMLAARDIEVYGQRTAAIVRALERDQERLALTGQPDVYRADFQDAVLRRVADVHYGEGDPQMFPYIFDREGRIQAHARHDRGDRLPPEQVARLIAASATGEPVEYVSDSGESQFAVVDHFPAWDWFVAYQVPLAVVEADARNIERQLLAAWGLAALVVLLGVALLVARVTRPLARLADAAETMARGDLEVDVDTAHPGEVGMLARGFVHMRDAIRRQLSELRESETRYRKIFDAGADGLLLLDENGRVVAANPAVTTTHGWTQAQLESRTIGDLLRDDDESLARSLQSPPADRPMHTEAVTLHREGRELETLVTAVRLSFQGRAHALIVLRDVTDQRQLERQLLQSQKLESVGRLAGGIAHDFNNLLTPVLGYSEMLLTDESVPRSVHPDLEAIHRAGDRARTLAQQLLAFSRRQVLEIKEVNVGEVIAGFEPILRRTLREDIELAINRQDTACKVLADPGQVEQIIMNLVINAMDAMPDGGQVTVSTRCHEIAPMRRHPAIDLVPGRYCQLIVRDTGTGVPEDVIDRVFEPFFTTKSVGKGTGLGLSTIHGIVNQHGGGVALRNRAEGGCEVEILLPCLPHEDREPVELGEHQSADIPHGRGEMVWLVEDDDGVRELAMSMLSRHGYQVRAFSLGADCVAAAEAGEAPDVVLTDVVMPGLNGPELRDRLRDLGFEQPVLFMSGYAGETLVRHGLADARADFVLKPLEARVLLEKLRRMLDATVAASDPDHSSPGSSDQR
jgi:PAS domain S-box-containing protein